MKERERVWRRGRDRHGDTMEKRTRESMEVTDGDNMEQRDMLRGEA